MKNNFKKIIGIILILSISLNQNTLSLKPKLTKQESAMLKQAKAMEKAGWEKGKFLVDGFPRNQDNYDGWNEVMGDITDVKFTLFLECSEQTMIDRIKKNQLIEDTRIQNIEKC